MSVEELALSESNGAEAEQWADHPLAHFLAAAWRNTVRSFSQQRAHYETLSEVDGVFRELVTHASESPERLAGSMLVRTHGSLLAASSLALSGQVAESYAMMRSVLRSALHGVFLAGNDERQRIWGARADDDRNDLCAESDERFDQDGGLHRHVQRSGDARARERLHIVVFAAQSHQAGHFVLGEADLLAAEFGQREICHLVVDAVTDVGGELCARGEF